MLHINILHNITMKSCKRIGFDNYIIWMIIHYKRKNRLTAYTRIVLKHFNECYKTIKHS